MATTDRVMTTHLGELATSHIGTVTDEALVTTTRSEGDLKLGGVRDDFAAERNDHEET